MGILGPGVMALQLVPQGQHQADRPLEARSCSFKFCFIGHKAIGEASSHNFIGREGLGDISNHVLEWVVVAWQ